MTIKWPFSYHSFVKFHVKKMGATACPFLSKLSVIMQGFFAHFDDLYRVMFPMTKSMFFPQFQGENSKLKEQKNTIL